MKKPPFVLVLIGLFFIACAAPQTPEAKQIPVSKTLEIGLLNIAGADSQAQLSATPEMLAISSGYEDELPDGPTSFDVFPDGRLIISDPLQSRLVIFSENGDYETQRLLGFAATRVRITGTPGEVLVDRRGSLEAFVSAASGEPARASGSEELFETHGAAKLVDRSTGSVTPEGKSPITVTFENDSLFLISVRNLGTMNGSTFVLLETSSGKVPIAVYRFLRIYDAGGKWTAEISGLAEDHYIFPEDEFRLHRNRLYQMSPGSEQLQIRIWEIPQ